MEHIFPPKTITLVANASVTINWTAPDIAERFTESIIKKAVAIRFSCSTTASSSVFCGVRYSTMTKDYLVAERKTLFFIPPSGTTEVTPASKPALGLLHKDIVSISLDLTSPVAGSATISLIIDDDPPPLSSDPGELIGLDAITETAFIFKTIVSFFTVIPATGADTTVISLQPPNGKRYIIDAICIDLLPTPSFPGLLLVKISITDLIANPATTIAFFRSFTDNHNTINYGFPNYPIPSGGAFQVDIANFDSTPYSIRAGYAIREVF